jgi:hypothetical protein
MESGGACERSQKTILSASCSVRAPLFSLLFFVAEILLKLVVVKFNCPG